MCLRVKVLTLKIRLLRHINILSFLSSSYRDRKHGIIVIIDLLYVRPYAECFADTLQYVLHASPMRQAVLSLFDGCRTCVLERRNDGRRSHT